MAQQSGDLQVVLHEFAGGWATDFGLSIGPGVDRIGGIVRYPYLLNAQNTQYELDGSPRRIGGATKLNSVVIESGDAVRGLYDFWKQGPSASPVQKRVIHAGDKVLNDDADGTFSVIISSLSVDKVPSYSQLDDKVFISSDGNSDADAPRSWDQSTVRVMQAPHTIVMFSGTGLNDVSTGGTYTQTSESIYTITLSDDVSSPEEFDFTQAGGSGDSDTGVQITGSPQALGSDGVTITFDATTGHTQGNVWKITTKLAPNFAFSEPHKDRLFAAGVATQASRLFYSTLFSDGGPEDFVNSGSGFIDIQPDDGDSITGLASHQNALFVFKGPHKGSIHRITGSSPKGTGSDGFARRDFVKGLGAAGHNSIFRFRDDVGFQWSDGSVHSLSTVAAHGDFKQASLSLPLDLKFLAKRVNHDALHTAWAATDSVLGVVLFAIPIDGSLVPNYGLMMDYRFDPVRWANWPAYDTECVARVLDSSGTNLPILMAGGSDGFVRKLNQDGNRIEDGAGIAFDIKMPFIDYGFHDKLKHPSVVSMACEPLGDFTPTFHWWSDQQPSKMQDLAILSASDRLATVAAGKTVFVLGTSKLAGVGFVQKTETLDQPGQFKAVQYGFTDNEESVEVSIRNFRVTIHIDTVSRGASV